jgi:hypothetical protein
MIKEDEKEKRDKYHESFIKKMSKVDNNQIPIHADYCREMIILQLLKDQIL